MKSYAVWFLITLASFSPGWSMGKKSSEAVSVLLVPAQPSMIQVGRDIAQMGEALMMSYALDAAAETPFLHIWDGNAWLPVSPKRFSTGNFLLVPVEKMVVVGLEDDQTATLIQTSLGWCPEVLHVSTVEVTPLINQLGKVFGFSRGDWEWIAARYQLALTDMTADQPKQSWYDSNQPEDIPRTSAPWKKQQTDTSLPPPSTSLTPVEDTL